MNAMQIATFLNINTDFSLGDSVAAACAAVDKADNKEEALRYWAWQGMCDSSNNAWFDSLNEDLDDSSWTKGQILENFEGHLDCVKEMYESRFLADD